MRIYSNGLTGGAVTTARPIGIIIGQVGTHRAIVIGSMRTINLISPREAAVICPAGGLFPFRFGRQSPANPLAVGGGSIRFIQDGRVIPIIWMYGIWNVGCGSDVINLR